jgi:hypothetical protein
MRTGPRCNSNIICLEYYYTLYCYCKRRNRRIKNERKREEWNTTLVDYSSCVYVNDSERESQGETGEERIKERMCGWEWEAGGGKIVRLSCGLSITWNERIFPPDITSSALFLRFHFSPTHPHSLLPLKKQQQQQLVLLIFLLLLFVTIEKNKKRKEKESASSCVQMS